MWTPRGHYITDSQDLIEFLNKEGCFHDFLIGSFTYNSQKDLIKLTIEEDFTMEDISNSPSLIWDLECQGISSFRMDSMDGLSKWWIYEVLFDGKRLQFQLVNGYFSFDVENFIFGIPSKFEQDQLDKLSKNN